MVTTAPDQTALRRRAWEAAASVVDPEIPVLTIADLGVLREVEVTDGRVEVAITPTYSGCPAMNMIALEIELALEREGFRNPKVRTVLSPAWTTDWMSEDGRRKLKEYGIAPPLARKLPPRAVRRATGRMSAMRLEEYRTAFRIWLNLLQGAVALQELPRTLRLFQMSLTGTAMSSRPSTSSLRAKRSNPTCGAMDCFVALLLAMTERA